MRRAVCARNTAACPAEFPPPTTTTSSRLPSGRVRLQYQDLKSFRGSIDSGRQARRPGSHNDQIAELRLIDCVIEAKAVGNLLIGRIPKDQSATTDQDWHLLSANVE